MAAKLINAGILANIIEGVDKCVLSPNTFLNWRCLMHMHMQFRHYFLTCVWSTYERH